MVFSRKLSIPLLLCVASGMANLIVGVESTEIVQTRGATKNGHFTTTYDAGYTGGNLCDVVVMIGVGTAMRRENYDGLSTLISTEQSIVTVFFDHNPGNMVKYGVEDYAVFVKDFTAHLGTLIPVCHDTTPKVILGGHSASGRAGFQALMHDEDLTADGFISLDGFQVSDTAQWGIGPGNIPKTIIAEDLPVLAWGFETQTCSVDPKKGGKAAYELSNDDHRVFFRVRNGVRGSRVGHCEFTDKGCGIFACKTRSPQNNDVKTVIAKSIQIFATGIVHGRKVSREDYDRLDTSNDTVNIEVYINTDTVQEQTEL